jgi:exodeoxyribonuclease VII small subunit
MKEKITFDEAYKAIEKIVMEIEQETIPLDQLAEKVKEAKSLIAFCNNKLKDIEAELNHDTVNEKG